MNCAVFVKKSHYTCTDNRIYLLHGFALLTSLYADEFFEIAMEFFNFKKFRQLFLYRLCPLNLSPWLLYIPCCW